MKIDEYYQGAIYDDLTALIFVIEYLVFEKQVLTPDDSREDLERYMKKYDKEIKRAWLNHTRY